MIEVAIFALAAAGSVSEQPSLGVQCSEMSAASSIVRRLSDLPREIRDDLTVLTEGAMGDRDGPLLQTDAPTAVEGTYPVTRFAQGLLFNDMWLVQFEVSLFSDVRTVTYRLSDDNRYHRTSAHYFHGPACPSIRAALSGVTTPGGF